MSNSKLATVHYWTKNYSSRNGTKITSIIIHHMAGNSDAKGCYNTWKTRNGSAHYAISSKGEIGQLIDEQYRAWSVSNAAADSKSVTMELANDQGASGSWHVSDKAIAACIELCVDICKRNGIKKLTFTGDKSGNLLQHKMFIATACPGPYLSGKFSYIADQVNKKLGSSTNGKEETKTVKKWTDYKVPFTVKITISDLYIKRGPGIGYAREKVDGSEFIKPGVYTITKVQKGGDYYWGKLKSSTAKSPRWIALEYTTFYKELSPEPTPTPTKTVQEKCCDWAKSIAAGGQYKYKSWESNDEKTKLCPICNNLTGKYKGWNCIGFAFASWKHGGGISTKCSCGVISDPVWNNILKASTDAAALKLAQDRMGLKDIQVIRNGGNAIPTSKLKAGDIVSFYNGNTYYHTALYIGNGQVADSTSSRNPNIKYGVGLYSGLKVAIRYTGK